MLVVKDNTNNERLVFIHLQKCAGTFINSLLSAMFEKSYRPFSSKNKKAQHHIPHYYLKKFRGDAARLNKLPSFGMIRNPWDFYVSMYHFEKEREDAWWAKGSIYNQLGKPDSFESFIKRLLGDNGIKDKEKSAGQNVIFKRMDDLNIGLLSARYLELYFDKDIFDCDANYIQKDFDKLVGVNHILKSESLLEELYQLLKDCRCNHSALKSYEYFNGFVNYLNIKKNKSNHKSYREYYTRELADLVGEKERVIIENHKYNL